VLREQYGLAWGAGQQRAYRLAVRTVPRLIALTPPVLRVWPLPGHNVILPAAARGGGGAAAGGAASTS
jgi:hypothetical protein